MQIWEVVEGKVKRVAAGKHSKGKKSDARSDFEKNATELRSKERKLKPQRPVAPIQHRG